MNRILIFLMLISGVSMHAQELNCKVVINAEQTGNSNLPVFKTLEKQIIEFVNNTKWTTKDFSSLERIESSMYINITEYSGDIFNATIQVQSSRPVFGSSYRTTVHNINDKDFGFRYLEFQNMVYNPNSFESNLISVFSLHGGDPHVSQAPAIANDSQGENTRGWRLSDGNQTGYVVIRNMLSQTFEGYRKTMYQDHRNRLDLMSENLKEAKTNISNALISLEAMNRVRPNSFLLRTFF